MSLPPILVDDASVVMLAQELSAERIIAVGISKPIPCIPTRTKSV